MSIGLKPLSQGTKVLCPKCQKQGVFQYFVEPDHTGVVACVAHDFRIIVTPLGSSEVADRRCFFGELEFTEEMRIEVARLKKIREDWENEPVQSPGYYRWEE